MYVYIHMYVCVCVCMYTTCVWYKDECLESYHACAAASVRLLACLRGK